MSERDERETIDEFLRRLEGKMRREPLSRRMSRRLNPYSHSFRLGFGAFLRRPPAEIFMITSMSLVVLTFLLDIFALKNWAFYASVLSIVFFILGIALGIVARHSPGYRKRWRGRELDYKGYGTPRWWSSLRNWLRRRGR
jgi:hypothetical protein